VCTRAPFKFPIDSTSNTHYPKQVSFDISAGAIWAKDDRASVDNFTTHTSEDNRGDRPIRILDNSTTTCNNRRVQFAFDYHSAAKAAFSTVL